MPIRHLGIPKKLSRGSVQRNDVRVIGLHEYPLSRHGDSAVDAAVSDEPSGAGTLIVPDLAASAGIQRVTLVRAADIHDALDDHRLRNDGLRTADTCASGPCPGRAGQSIVAPAPEGERNPGASEVFVGLSV